MKVERVTGSTPRYFVTWYEKEKKNRQKKETIYVEPESNEEKWPPKRDIMIHGKPKIWPPTSHVATASDDK
jgi:hypothetical protein